MLGVRFRRGPFSESNLNFSGQKNFAAEGGEKQFDPFFNGKTWFSPPNWTFEVIFGFSTWTFQVHQKGEIFQDQKKKNDALAKKKKVNFFFKIFSWVVAPIFDGLDVGIQKMSKFFFFAFWLKR